MIKGPEVRERYVGVLVLRGKSWREHRRQGRWKRGMWREARLGVRVTCGAGRGVYMAWAAMEGIFQGER